MKALYRRCLTHPHLTWGLLLLTLLLSLPALWGGIGGDDYAQRARLLGLDQAVPEGPLPAQLDLFEFYPEDPTRRALLQQTGFYPWWSHPDLRVAFLRPLASATHWLDYQLWPDNFPLQHAHSLLWALLGVAVVLALYRRFFGVGLWAGLAGLMFALEDAHAMPVAWLANRNALMALVLGGTAVLLHRDWRERGGAWRPALSALLLAASLLSAEAAIGAAGYIAAYQLTLDRRAWWRRALALLPTVSVVLAWRLLVRAWGFGVRGSGLYVDPGSNPAGAINALAERVPQLLLAQWLQVSADPWLFLPRGGQLTLTAAGWLLALGMGLAFLPLLRQSALARFWGLGMLLALVPAGLAFPMDRQLLFAGIGAFGLLACQVERMGWFDERPCPANAPTRVLTWTFFMLHALVVFVWYPIRIQGISGVFKAFGQVSEQAPMDEAVPGQTFVFVNGSDLLASYVFVLRAMQGEPTPRRIALLSSMLEDNEVQRLDEYSLLIRPAGGFLASVGGRLARSLDLPFQVGEMHQQQDFQLTVTEVLPDGRPAAARFTFDAGLDDPALRWLCTRQGALTPCTLPKVGESLSLPATMPAFR